MRHNLCSSWHLHFDRPQVNIELDLHFSLVHMNVDGLLLEHLIVIYFYLLMVISIDEVELIDVVVFVIFYVEVRRILISNSFEKMSMIKSIYYI